MLGGRSTQPTNAIRSSSGHRAASSVSEQPSATSRYDPKVITAIVFVKADVARIPEVAEAIAALDGVSEVYSVTGQIDLIAMVRVTNHDDVASVVADKLNKVDGVTATETHIAFRAYSRHDLESAFSLGLD